MATDIVVLNSREEVARFEEYFDKYLAMRTQSPLERLSLLDAYDHLQRRPDGGRIFSALVDVQITFLLLYLDLHSIDATWNQLLSKGKLQAGSLFDSKTKFYGTMEIHRFSSAYVLRYRALWDKLMGLMILIYAPDEYESFLGAKSKKLRFQKLAEKHQFAEEQFLNKLGELLNRFDSAFPSEPAYGSGEHYDHSIALESLKANPQIQLLGFWNAVNGFISKFGKLITKASKS